MTLASQWPRDGLPETDVPTLELIGHKRPMGVQRGLREEQTAERISSPLIFEMQLAHASGQEVIDPEIIIPARHRSPQDNPLSVSL